MIFKIELFQSLKSEINFQSHTTVLVTQDKHGNSYTELKQVCAECTNPTADNLGGNQEHLLLLAP